MSILTKWYKRITNSLSDIIIVSGLPRSGTSMMMKMLGAGGITLLTDNTRKPDRDNPKGYFEFELVKKLENDNSWVKGEKGKAIKVVSPLLFYLPLDLKYKVIFMRRDMQEILASQKQMIIRRGKYENGTSDEQLAEKFQEHIIEIKEWLEKQSCFDVMYVNYNDILKNHMKYCKEINDFLNNIPDIKKMARTIDISLHRQRRT